MWLLLKKNARIECRSEVILAVCYQVSRFSCDILKFVFYKKATKIDEIFTVNLTLCSKCQIDGEDFVNCCGLRKHKFYEEYRFKVWNIKKSI